MKKRVSTISCGLLFGIIYVTGTSARLWPQDALTSPTVQVEKTKMGAYRALAQLTFQAFKKKDYATASTLARILERTWDKGEQCGLAKNNPDLREEIDHPMDDFIKPIIGYTSTIPAEAAVESAYSSYLEKLKLGD